jgi:hypothetical protein
MHDLPAQPSLVLVNLSGAVVYPHDTVMIHRHSRVSYTMDSWECDARGECATVYGIAAGSRVRQSFSAQDFNLRVMRRHAGALYPVRVNIEQVDAQLQADAARHSGTST